MEMGRRRDRRPRAVLRRVLAYLLVALLVNLEVGTPVWGEEMALGNGSFASAPEPQEPGFWNPGSAWPSPISSTPFLERLPSGVPRSAAQRAGRFSGEVPISYAQPPASKPAGKPKSKKAEGVALLVTGMAMTGFGVYVCVARRPVFGLDPSKESTWTIRQAVGVNLMVGGIVLMGLGGGRLR